MSQEINAANAGEASRVVGEPILKVDSLTKKFGGLTAVDNLSFEVYEQEILGVIGPNGAGKSTTFNCIFGTYKPTRGTVRFDGEDITGKPAHRVARAGIARTFQTFRPLEDRDVLANVELSKVSDKLFTFDGIFGGTEDEAQEVCERVGLGDDVHKTPDELPHAGMIRLEIARAIATDPDLLLIDEPFAGLSATEVERLSTLFSELREEGLTLIIIDHNMRGLMELIDRGVVINFGSKIAEGSPEEIQADETVQEAYLGGEEI
ncbi:ABC transporter ATP-binding protein [Halosolutus halophilus]|uniref:ABC transporter ATP-binding protein n=1 Tax=Halosolutus halophilus TaxID=1552990 RepID=UPI002235144C|nr:ABC transporter ATP-binding protein [Halosolutus halophilus]